MDLIFGGMGTEAWSMTTYVFYLLVIGVCFASACIFSGVKFQWVEHREAVNRIQIALPMFLLLLVKGLSICGTDVVGGYRLNFDTATSVADIHDWTLEKGYILLCVLIRNLTTNYSVFLFVVAMITIIPVYYVIQKYREYVDVPITILAYTAIFFFKSLSPIRIFIAVSFCLLSFSAIIEKKYVLSICLVFIATLFHITSIVMILPCVFMGFQINKKVIGVGLTAVLGALIVSRHQLELLMRGRYSIYSVSTELDFGMEVVYYYVPLILIYFIVRLVMKEIMVKEYQRRLFEVSFVWVLLGAFLRMLAYVVEIFGRMDVYTVPIILFLGVSLQIIRQSSPKLFVVARCIVIIYVLLRFQIYLNGYYESEGLMPYQTCFGLVL